MVQRIVKPSKNNSFFLFGARGTGKSTFIQQQFLTPKNALKIDLLDPELEDRYARSPMRLYDEIASKPKAWTWIFIDEVQKVPRLLDVIHKSIEDLDVKFILTGSSARKLKRGGANLLAGRAFLYSLFPLTERELGDSFRLEEALRWGTLPKLLTLPADEDKKQYLKSYGQIYLKEEVIAEQLIRNVDPFRGFLEVAAQMSGKVINYSNISQDVGVDPKTIQTYFEILSDTWLGHFLPSFHQSVRKSQRLSPKFYFFDLGVKNSLSQTIDTKPSPGNSFYGECFEHFVINEVHRLNQYLGKDFRLSYLATKNHAELDLILSKANRHIAIEIKSTSNINAVEVNKMRALAGDIKNIRKMYFVSNDRSHRLIEGVECMHWRSFLDAFARL